MKNLEIEKKYLIKSNYLPKDLDKYKHKKIIQGFICFKPCVRIRKVDKYYILTIKTKPKNNLNDLVRNEYEFDITKKMFDDLITMIKGALIEKTRYYIPYKKWMIELDIFHKQLKGLIYAEVEFKNVKEANNFLAPNWFYKNVTGIEKYKNTNLAICKNVEKLFKYNM